VKDWRLRHWPAKVNQMLLKVNHQERRKKENGKEKSTIFLLSFYALKTANIIETTY